jgi:hypothetical protein
LSRIKNNDEIGFKDILVSKKKLLRRVENLCYYFKENMPKYRNSLKKVRNYGERADYSCGRTKLDPSRPVTSIKVNRDSKGNIIYPIHVSQTLRILDLGRVEFERPNYHSSRNLFPIGFKSVREYTSMFKLNERVDYICEILDGGNSPLFKVTPGDDPDNPIIKDASSGAWIEICKKINELQGTNRKHVTVSGPDRYGLAEPAVT